MYEKEIKSKGDLEFLENFYLKNLVEDQDGEIKVGFFKEDDKKIPKELIEIFGFLDTSYVGRSYSGYKASTFYNPNEKQLKLQFAVPYLAPREEVFTATAIIDNFDGDLSHYIKQLEKQISFIIGTCYKLNVVYNTPRTKYSLCSESFKVLKSLPDLISPAKKPTEDIIESYPWDIESSVNGKIYEYHVREYQSKPTDNASTPSASERTEKGEVKKGNFITNLFGRRKK